MTGPRLPPALEALADGGDVSADPSTSSDGDDWVEEEEAAGTESWAPLAAAAPPLPPIDAQIAAPALSPSASAAFAALRGALASGERSPRVHALTTYLHTSVNAADSSAWAVRWECARVEGVSSPAAEAGFVDALAAAGGAGAAGLKVYQVWRYRARLAMESGGDGEPIISPAVLARERAFADAALARDAKHYHAWAHRAALAGAAGPGAW